MTTLLRSKSANSDQLVSKNEQVSQLEKDVQKLKDENETYVKKLEGFQKTVTENGETMKDFITGHQALQGNFLKRPMLRKYMVHIICTEFSCNKNKRKFQMSTPPFN